MLIIVVYSFLYTAICVTIIFVYVIVWGFMYLKKIIVRNYGSIKNIDYNMPFDNNKNPIPLIVVGKNGTGKTLLLINILNSIIEIKKKFYTDISDVSNKNYYRFLSKEYIKSSENFSYFKSEFENEVYNVDLAVNNYEKFLEEYSDNNIPNIDINNEGLKEKDNGFYNKSTKPQENVFNKNIYLYFPVDRFYIPTWENTKNEKLSFVIDSNNLLGYDKSGIVQYNILDNVESWLLDVVIDKMLYEGKIFTGKQGEKIVAYQVFDGKNNRIHNCINDILTKLFACEKYKSIRFGISQKQYRKIAVIGIKNDNTQEEIVPKFSNLSSGEIMVLCIFSSIIRAYDKINANNTFDIEAISGIVIIDEIDIHLHSDLLRDVLPEIIKMFPKIQFIISSHSPFFLLGMKEKFGNKCEFLALPDGITLNNIENFEEIKKCYSMVDDSYKDLLDTINKYEKQIEDSTKTLIITEGKTDWKHYKHALKVFQSQNKFKDLDVNFLEYNNDDFSDSKLESFLENASKIPHKNKIIGIFDNDSKIGKKYETFVDFGNNVFGCSITDTQGYNCGISVEMLYKKDDLKITDSNGRRIYLSEEFTEKSRRLATDLSISCNNNKLTEAIKNKTTKIIDSGVFDIKENSLALSKNEFADYIYNEIGDFTKVSVDSFSEIFSKISKIIKINDGN